MFEPVLVQKENIMDVEISSRYRCLSKVINMSCNMDSLSEHIQELICSYPSSLCVRRMVRMLSYTVPPRSLELYICPMLMMTVSVARTVASTLGGQHRW